MKKSRVDEVHFRITARRYSLTQTGFGQEGSQDSWTTDQTIFGLWKGKPVEDATGEDELTLQRQFPTQPWGQGSIYTRRQ